MTDVNQESLFNDLSDDITMRQFEALIEEAYRIKAKKAEAEAQVKTYNEELHRLNSQILEYMEEFEKDSYKSKWGTVVRMKRLNVKVPKTPEDKKALRDYLAERGLEDMLTVNSQTLNAFYKQELEVAKEEGAFEVKIPGIDDPTYRETLTLRK